MRAAGLGQGTVPSSRSRPNPHLQTRRLTPPRRPTTGRRFRSAAAAAPRLAASARVSAQLRVLPGDCMARCRPYRRAAPSARGSPEREKKTKCAATTGHGFRSCSWARRGARSVSEECVESESGLQFFLKDSQSHSDREDSGDRRQMPQLSKHPPKCHVLHKRRLGAIAL